MRGGDESSSRSIAEDLLLPARPSTRIAAGIRWYARRLLRRKFHAVRLARGSAEVLAPIDRSSRPTILLLGHASWWDPILAIWIWDRFFGSRGAAGPMHRRELERFRFFRAVGMFGIDPDDPASLEAMRDYLRPRMTQGGEVLLLTPQGTLTDVRAPIRLRPGAASMAASLEEVEVVAVAVEYAFWLDQRPEVFLRATGCRPIAEGRLPSTADWHRAMQGAMQENAAALASKVIARDPAAFEVLVGGETSIHPVYDWWLRLWGRAGAIDREGRDRGGAP